MSLPSSPVPSSPSGSSDDFAAFLDNELQSASSDGKSVSDRDDDKSEDSDQECSTVIGQKRKRPVDEPLCTSKAEPGSTEMIECSGTKISKTCPPHPGFMWGVCIRCGERRSNNEPNDERGVALRYIHAGLEVSRVEADRIRKNELNKVLSKRKLYLVLDLDHTLLNSARYCEVTMDEVAYMQSVYLPNLQAPSNGPANYNTANAIQEKPTDRGSGLHNLESMNMQMWTKLRPFAHQLLESASKMFDMYLYTMGEHNYAHAMRRLLDPARRYFEGQVISQNESTCRTSKDLDIMLGAESAVIILDDTEGVWPKHKSNLVLMERYHFFSSSCKQFGIPAASLLEAEKDESESDGTLANTLELLQCVHSAFFHGKYQDTRGETQIYDGEKDVREIMRSIRSKVLADCKVVFSRIIPTSYPCPETHPFWRLTEELGATCTNQLDSTVTHVVGMERGTDKARWAVENKRFLVHPKWVEAALYTWKRPPEENYSIDDAPFLTTFSKTVSRPRIQEEEQEP